MSYNWIKIRHKCLLCDHPVASGEAICHHCLPYLPWIERPCPRCGREMGRQHREARICGDCLSRPPDYHTNLSPFLYQPPIPYLIRQMKFHQRLDIARLLGLLMVTYLERTVDEWPEAIVPVPLHPRRLRERGYNQALELARPVAQRLDLGIDTRLVQRVRPTLEQSHLKPAERKGNIRNAFTVGHPGGYRHIAILDDVVTTGHTVSELARVLKRSGVERVDVWSCSRSAGE